MGKVEQTITLPKGMYDLMYAALLQQMSPEFFETISNELSHEEMSVKVAAVGELPEFDPSIGHEIGQDIIEKAFAKQPLDKNLFPLSDKDAASEMAMEILNAENEKKGIKTTLMINDKTYDVDPNGKLVGMGFDASIGEHGELIIDPPIHPKMIYTNMPNPPPTELALIWPKSNVAYKLSCIDFGSQKIQLIKAVRELFTWGLAEAKGHV